MCKAALSQKRLHDFIVTMRVHPQVATLFHCPFYAKLANPLYCPTAGDAMYDPIGAIIQPTPVNYRVVRRLNVLALTKEEGANDFSA